MLKNEISTIYGYLIKNNTTKKPDKEYLSDLQYQYVSLLDYYISKYSNLNRHK